MDPLEIARQLVEATMEAAASFYGPHWDSMREQVRLFMLAAPLRGYGTNIEIFWACCDLVYQGIPQEPDYSSSGPIA